jgi:hypothetical protein
MKLATMAAIGILALSGFAAAADKPNFSGEWKMNAAKSDFGTFPPPASFVRKITHTDSSLTIVENQSANGADTTTTRSLTTDGKISTQEMNGVSAACAAAWEGTALIATTTLDCVGLKFKDNMSLSSDGKVLTSKVQIGTNQGDAEITIVFDRQ